VITGKLSKRIIVDRLDWVDRMLAEINALPIKSEAEFLSDSRNIWAAESCLRRALEALFDLGRHILAKGFGKGVTEYKEVAAGLLAQKVLSASEADLLYKMAGYRNRLVHFYHDVSPGELYEVCTFHLDDVMALSNAFRVWIRNHPEMMDENL